MNNRRNFLKTSLVVATGVAVAKSVPAFAKQGFASGIVYTKENPGKWAKKVGSHLPVVTLNGGKVTVETMHGMSDKHYIVRHTIVSADGEVLGENTFSPTDKKAISVFEVKGNHSQLYATSFCNKHDFWLAEFSV